MITMMLYMPGTIQANEIGGRNRKIRALILVLEDSAWSMFQEISSNDKVFFFSFYSSPQTNASMIT
jgi:hypothetical protein